jgi:SAM-dependent methyltransferase
MYRILEYPFVFRLSQSILAPGMERHFDRLLPKIRDSRDNRPWLDIGCGPTSRVQIPGGGLFGADISHSYVSELSKTDCIGCVSDSRSLPFPENHFGAVWSIGLFHHLPDAVVTEAISEMVRVCQKDGDVIICDGVYPVQWWRRPIPYFIRLADRGRFMRKQAAFEKLLPEGLNWSVERQTCAWNGLEMLLCVGRKEVC